MKKFAVLASLAVLSLGCAGEPAKAPATTPAPAHATEPAHAAPMTNTPAAAEGEAKPADPAAAPAEATPATPDPAKTEESKPEEPKKE